MSTGEYKKKEVKLNDSVGNDDNNTPKVNTTSYKYDESLTRGRNLINMVKTAPQSWEERARTHQELKKQYQADFKEFKESGGNQFEFEKEYGSMVNKTYKGATSIVDKKPKKRGTPK